MHHPSFPPTLTPHDKFILSQIFPPLSPLPTANFIDPTLPSPPSNLLHAEAKIIASLEALPLPSATTLLHTALAEFNALIEKNPDYASAYNNRAQVTRLLSVGDDIRALQNAWPDLSRAIDLADQTRRGNKVSRHEAEVLANAYTQRAWLVWKLARARHLHHQYHHQQSDLQDKLQSGGGEGDTNLHVPEQLRAMTSEQLDDVASREFEMGGRFGNAVAREMAVRTNGHARLCAGVVREAMDRERRR